MAFGKSFEELVRESRQKVYNFALRLCGNQADAADLMQEAFTQAYRHFSSFDRSRSFSSWVLAIAHHRFVNRITSLEARRTVSLEQEFSRVDDDRRGEDLAGGDPEPMDALILREDELLLQRALDRLEPHYRSAVILCDIEGWSYDEIARACQCPIGTVKSRVHQGRKQIRAMFEGCNQAGGRS